MNIIKLNAQVYSNLDWKNEKKGALDFLTNNEPFYWQLDLGLFDKLTEPLSDSQQFLSLELALQHFRTDIYPEFAKLSKGTILYKGNLSFSSLSIDELLFQEWIEEKKITCLLDREILKKIYTRDIALDYIKFLAAQLPEELPACLQIHSDEKTPAEYFHLLSQDAFEYLNIILEGGFSSDFPLSHNPNPPNLPYAFCLPSKQLAINQLNKAIYAMEKNHHSFRVVCESMINQLWQGVDYLIVFSDFLSDQGKRKLKGFSATGGTIVYVGNPLGMPIELSFEQFLKRIQVAY